MYGIARIFAHPNFRLWLQADSLECRVESPLYPRKETSARQERFGLKQRTLDVRLYGANYQAETYAK
jgi:predicted alpha-1,6-mannanase (GH76 family)